MNNYEVGVPSKTKHGESEFEGGSSRGLPSSSSTITYPVHEHTF